jgi:hypothetical protein
MTVDRFLKPGEGEMVKGAVHATVFGLAVLCGVYNAAAWIARRERHLGVNAVLYTGLAIWEAVHVQHHHHRASQERSVSPAARERSFKPSTPASDPISTPEWVSSPFAQASTASHPELL